jgi:hypothetical protein
MANKWLMHVKKTMKTMKSRGTYKKGDGLKKVILEAKKSYKKHKGGEEAAPESSPETSPVSPAVMGGRRKGRKGGKTRRHRK